MSLIKGNISLENDLTPFFEAFEKGLNGQSNSKLHEKRSEAIRKYVNTHVPTTKDEEWKFTNLRTLAKKEFEIGKESEVSKETIDNYSFLNVSNNRIVFVNGKFNNDLTNIISSQEDVYINNLPNAYKEKKEIIDQYFSSIAPEGEKFTSLNTAFTYDGLFIHLKRSKVIEEPVHIIYIQDAQENNTMNQSRSLVIVEENAQLKLVEQYITLGENESLQNNVSEFIVAESARLDHIKIQDDKNKAHQVNNTNVVQAQKSYFANTCISLSGGLIRNNLNITQKGERCESFMNGLFFLQGKTHVDNHTMVDHTEPNCESNELYKGVVDDKSRGVFNGKVYVRSKAQKTNAYQQNANIILSDDAKIDTKPQLEIWADDVKCSHGATIGALDEEPLFFLRSRGIRENKAKALLLQGFVQEVIDRISIEDVRNHVEKIMDNRLN